MSSRRMFTALWALAGLLMVSVAHELMCSPSADGCSFTISDPVVDPEPRDCVFDWLNGTGYTIANRLNGSQQVLNHSINHLTIKACIDGLHFRRSCVSEGRAMTADCKANCSAIGQQIKNGGDIPMWVIVLIIVTLLLLGLVVYCCKDKLPRINNCWTARGSYSCVDKKSPSSEVVGEEV